MDIGKSFTFPFDDQQWMSKLGIGAAVTLVPILNFAWSGYMVELIRNVTDQVPEPLPAWDNLEKKFLNGLILLAVGLVYALPILIVFFLPLGLFVISSILSGNSNLQDAARTIAGAGGVLFYCLLCVFLIYGLALSIVYPAVLVKFSRSGTFASCFKFREIFEMISKRMDLYFTAWGVSLAASLGAGFVSGAVNMMFGLIPCVGWIVGFVVAIASVVYSSVVYSHLFGQFGLQIFGPDAGTGSAISQAAATPPSPGPN